MRKILVIALMLAATGAQAQQYYDKEGRLIPPPVKIQPAPVQPIQVQLTPEQAAQQAYIQAYEQQYSKLHTQAPSITPAPAQPIYQSSQPAASQDVRMRVVSSTTYAGQQQFASPSPPQSPSLQGMTQEEYIQSVERAYESRNQLTQPQVIQPQASQPSGMNYRVPGTRSMYPTPNPSSQSSSMTPQQLEQMRYIQSVEEAYNQKNQTTPQARVESYQFRSAPNGNIQLPVTLPSDLQGSYPSQTQAPTYSSQDAYVQRAQNDKTSSRFYMTQDGQTMTADDFDAWLKERGIRIIER